MLKFPHLIKKSGGYLTPEIAKVTIIEINMYFKMPAENN